MWSLHARAAYPYKLTRVSTNLSAAMNAEASCYTTAAAIATLSSVMSRQPGRELTVRQHLDTPDDTGNPAQMIPAIRHS